MSSSKGMASGNLFGGISVNPEGEEQTDILLQHPSCRMERIVSMGQRTPSGEWYDQKQDEWVVLLTGSSSLQIEGEESPRLLGPGDWIFLPAHCRHRVEETDPANPSIWLAVHLNPGS